MVLFGLGFFLERILMDENFIIYIFFNGKFNLIKFIKIWFYLLVNRIIVLVIFFCDFFYFFCFIWYKKYIFKMLFKEL